MAEVLLAFIAAWVMYAIVIFVAHHATPFAAGKIPTLLQQLVVRVIPIAIGLGALLGLTWLIGNVPAANGPLFISGMVAGAILGIVNTRLNKR